MDWLTLWSAIEALATVAATLLAGGALYQTYRLFKAQQRLAEDMHQQQQKLNQRQLFLPVYEQFKEISDIDPDAPVWPDVIRAANFLELLGVCWEGNLIDREVLLRVYRERVIDLYEQIEKCLAAPKKNKTGKEVLEQNRAAVSLYQHLKQEDLERDKISPL